MMRAGIAEGVLTAVPNDEPFHFQTDLLLIEQIGLFSSIFSCDPK